MRSFAASSPPSVARSAPIRGLVSDARPIGGIRRSATGIARVQSAVVISHAEGICCLVVPVLLSTTPVMVALVGRAPRDSHGRRRGVGPHARFRPALGCVLTILATVGRHRAVVSVPLLLTLLLIRPLAIRLVLRVVREP